MILLTARTCEFKATYLLQFLNSSILEPWEYTWVFHEKRAANVTSSDNGLPS